MLPLKYLFLCLSIQILLAQSYSLLKSGPTEGAKFIVTTTAKNVSVAEGISFSVRAIKADGSTDTTFNSVLSLGGVMGNDTTLLYFDQGETLALWTRNDAATQMITDTTLGAIGTSSSFKLSNNDHSLAGGWLHPLGGLYQPARLSYYLRISETVKSCGYVSLREYKNYQWSNCVTIFVDSQGRLMTHYMDTGVLTTSPGVPLTTLTWYKIDVTLDWSQSRIQIWLDDSPIASAPFFTGPATNIAGLFLYNYEPTTVWIDEIKLVHTEANWLHIPANPPTITLTNGIYNGALEFLSPGNNISIRTVYQTTEPVVYSSGNSLGIAVSTVCSDGKWYDQSRCADCPLGTALNYSESSNCTECPVGYFADVPGLARCKKCEPGTFNSVPGQSQCAGCPPGTYMRNEGSSDCISCGYGYYANGTSNTNCTACPPGYFANKTGASLCEICPVGYSSNVTGISPSYIPGLRASDGCYQCPPGTYSNSQGSSYCQPCPNGYTSLYFASDKCIPITNTVIISESGKQVANSSHGNMLGLIVGLSTSLGVLLIAGVFIFVWYRNKKRREIDEEKQISARNSVRHSMKSHGSFAVQITTVEDIVFQEKLGTGNFGEVYKGLWHGSIPVALKRLRSTNATDSFEKEAIVLHALRHPHVVLFIGIYTDLQGEKYLVTEFLPKGPLQSTFEDEVSIMDLLEMDIALRNLLAMNGENGKVTVKVSDFGLSRFIDYEDFYKTDIEEMPFPVRWSPCEVMLYGRFSFQSDVYSFGITMWEIMTLGEFPFAGLSNSEVIDAVRKGARLPKEEIPEDIYNLMLQCWHEDPEKRPDMHYVLSEINDLIEKYKPLSSPVITRILAGSRQ